MRSSGITRTRGGGDGRREFDEREREIGRAREINSGREG